MTIILPALGVAFAAFCVWLTVRVVSRRERWAKWLAGFVFLGLPILYFSGYACMLRDPLFIDTFGVGPFESEEIYRGRDRDQQFWKSVFGPAHWLDKKVRRSKWFLE